MSPITKNKIAKYIFPVKQPKNREIIRINIKDMLKNNASFCLFKTLKRLPMGAEENSTSIEKLSI